MSKFYAVARGRSTGIYRTWDKAKSLVDGFVGARYKSFPTKDQAEQWLVDPQTLVQKPRKLEPAKQVRSRIRYDTDSVVIYTDGSCINSNGGWAYVVVDSVTGREVGNDYGRVPVSTCTNNIAELYAIGKAIKSQPAGTKIQLFTDSRYSMNSVSVWVLTWLTNGWLTSKGEPVENKKLIKRIHELSDNVSYNYVKAHVGNEHNERADRLANLGRYQ